MTVFSSTRGRERRRQAAESKNRKHGGRLLPSLVPPRRRLRGKSRHSQKPNANTSKPTNTSSHSARTHTHSQQTASQLLLSLVARHVDGLVDHHRLPCPEPPRPCAPLVADMVRLRPVPLVHRPLRVLPLLPLFPPSLPDKPSSVPVGPTAVSLSVSLDRGHVQGDYSTRSER